MKLYDIPEGSKLMLEISDGNGTLEPVTFHHIDGMYSFCTVDRLETEKEGSGIVHLSAICPLKKIGEHYELAEEKD